MSTQVGVGSSPIFCMHIILLKSLKFKASGIFFFEQKGLTLFDPFLILCGRIVIKDLYSISSLIILLRMNMDCIFRYIRPFK